MAEGADGQQFSTIAGEGGVDVPPESANTGCVGGGLRGGHFFHALRVEHGESAEKVLGEDGEVIGGGEQAGVTGDASHAARGGIVHGAAKHGVLLVVLGGRDARAPFRGRKKSRVPHGEGSEDI